MTPTRFIAKPSPVWTEIVSEMPEADRPFELAESVYRIEHHDTQKFMALIPIDDIPELTYEQRLALGEWMWRHLLEQEGGIFDPRFSLRITQDVTAKELYVLGYAFRTQLHSPIPKRQWERY